ncbi:MAG: hypothetical protein KKB31_06925 [Nanoarchaeota archaeon]|nr:hypothetical protein [Nanoarchaeota archaeon]
MRRIFSKTIHELAEKDDKIIFLAGDYCSQMNNFARDFPTRFYNVGILEQTTMGIAAGLALEGMKPYFYTITPFATERALEQLKIDVLLNRANVKIVGFDDYPKHGPTHKGMDVRGISKLLNDYAIPFLGDVPEGGHILCFTPENSEETRKAVLDSYNDARPAIIRLKWDPHP